MDFSALSERLAPTRPTVPCTDRTREREVWRGNGDSLKHCPPPFTIAAQASMTAVEASLNITSIALHTCSSYAMCTAVISLQFEDACRKFELYSIALDESVDVSGSAEDLLFKRGVNSDL
ncbi:hypothetical protein J6590_040571 [Homalodisca vitripennis]|nr:hypothetical protein J6590_040571 [Homalodisca vitripennis]